MSRSRRPLTALGAMALVMSLAAGAQPAARMPRIGYLGNSSPSLESNLFAAFRQGLRDLGYIDGQNIVIESRWAEGDNDRFSALLADLIRLKVDVIVAAGTPGILAAKQATKTIPIVMAVSGDAVGTSLVDSLARPGGNVTGLTTIVPDLEGKRLELLKAMIPRLSRVAVLWNPANPVDPVIFKQTQVAARAFGLTVQSLEVRRVQELESVFAALPRERPDALVLLADRFLLTHRKRIVELIAKYRLPAMCAYEDFVSEGALMSYGPSYTDSFRRSAGFVDKILKGAKPRELPVEQPTKLELVINRKTAKALGLTIPPELLVLAEKVIE